MFDRSLRQLVLANARSLLAQSLYTRCGIDVTRPVQTYALMTTRCIAKCRMCNFWREPPSPELTTSDWINYVTQLKEFSGGCNINFSGGEPLIREDLFEVLEACKKLGMPTGITTNGLLLNERNVGRLLDADVFNINVSIDSVDDEVQDSMRGVPGMLARVKDNLTLLMERKQRTGSRVRVVIKSIVCAETLPGLPDVVAYAKDLGASGVSFQPIFEWSDESKQMSDMDCTVLDRVVNTLADMRDAGLPIMNSTATIRQWQDYFQGKPPARRSACVVALRDLFVYPNGDAIVCGTCNTVIGNIAESSVRDIWFSDTARKLRSSLIRCGRLCLQTCVVKRTLRDYLSLVSRLR